MTEIRISPLAMEDLRQIRQYITVELTNEAAAVKTVTKIMDGIRMLAIFPDSGAPLSGVVGFDTDYRYVICGRYAVFYRHDGGAVFIDRVLYGRRDFMRILFDWPESGEEPT